MMKEKVQLKKYGKNYEIYKKYGYEFIFIDRDPGNCKLELGARRMGNRHRHEKCKRAEKIKRDKMMKNHK